MNQQRYVNARDCVTRNRVLRENIFLGAIRQENKIRDRRYRSLYTLINASPLDYRDEMRFGLER